MSDPPRQDAHGERGDAPAPADPIEEHSETIALLRASAAGDSASAERLLTLLYDDLRRLAEHMLSRERPDHTLQPTALVHEAYLKLVHQDRATWQDRQHFFAVAAQAIRRILVDHARGHRRLKRGGDRRRVSPDILPHLASAEEVDLVALDEALQTLSAINPLQARIVELRFFGGLTINETADILSMAKRTVDREWACAKAWLYRALS